MACQRGLPAAFQRMPPASQTERSKPQSQRIFHTREWLSIDSAHERGNIFRRTRCIGLILIASIPMRCFNHNMNIGRGRFGRQRTARP
jgi:hypothetical protein